MKSGSQKRRRGGPMKRTRSNEDTRPRRHLQRQNSRRPEANHRRNGDAAGDDIRLAIVLLAESGWTEPGYGIDVVIRGTRDGPITRAHDEDRTDPQLLRMHVRRIVPLDPVALAGKLLCRALGVALIGLARQVPGVEG